MSAGSGPVEPIIAYQYSGEKTLKTPAFIAFSMGYNTKPAILKGSASIGLGKRAVLHLIQREGCA